LSGVAPFAGEKRPARGSIVYTSGTTGRPKGVRRASLEGEARQRFEDLTTSWFGLRPGIRTVMAGPMYHSAPNTYAKAAMHAGGSVVLMPRFDAEELLRIIQDERITHIHLVPTMFARLLRLPPEIRSRYDVSSLEFVIHGAAPCSPELKRLMIAWWGPVIYEYYAATETGMVCRCDSEEWLRKPGTVGRAWPGRSVRIYDDQGRVLPRGEIGEIYSSLTLVPQFTYVNQDAQRRAIERDGMVTNGDMGYLDEDDYLFLCDRKRDMVISGGVNIYPAEIESALADCPGVHDCAVFGIPDEEYGEALAVAIETEAGATVSGDQVRAFLRERLANYKVPRHIVFEAKLPRDDSGKLLKRILKEPYWQGAGRRI
jgi:long-chain acyl-CoA synthetase